MGSLLVLIDANAKGQGVQSVLTNVSFALDSMTRNIRTGTDYYCDTNTISPLPGYGETHDCTSGTYIVYTDGRTGNRVGFRYNKDAGSIERRINDGAWLPITSSEIHVTSFLVTVIGSGSQPDVKQPTAHIFTQGYIVSDPDTKPDFELQTTITQRTLDF
jgi:hypothetical protein